MIFNLMKPIPTEQPEPTPERYKPLWYIESSGTQYIDTGFKPNGNTKVEIEFEALPTSSLSSYYAFFGCRTNGNVNFFALVKALDTSYNLYWQYGTKYSNIWSISDIGEFAKHRIVYASGAGTVIDWIPRSYPVEEFQSAFNLYLFGNNQNGTPNMLSHARIYWCRIYDNGTLVREFVPCETAEGDIGMWDKVEDKFYGNAGAGKFVAGLPSICYSYNDYVLPPLPEWDKELYPYAFIDHGASSDLVETTDFVITDKPLFYWDGEEKIHTEKCDFCYWRYDYEAFDWGEPGGDPFAITRPDYLEVKVFGKLIWSNHDVLYEGSNEVYFEATEPIPIYE